MNNGTQTTLGAALEKRFYFTCTTCGRRGRYRRESLIKMLGGSISIEAVPVAVATKTRCVLAMKEPDQGKASAPCGAHFDLAAMYLDDKRAEEALKDRR
jgi:hypothetical protein